ncbi:hypothetical protein SASPL_123674 [Salvia splendens]|uniref:WD repeat-containing protein 23 n=1 Tax=Salvia splendens TaxID=180675 RepID=A0A8X8ZTE7_SALSN|nr:hypothetical protein SASPL_123674 [Salvia splendens]
MLSVAEDTDADSTIGYYFGKLEIENELSYGSSDYLPSRRKCDSFDQDIAQLTKLQSRPNEHFSCVSPGNREFPVSTLKMLAGREANLSGRGRFSLPDCRHVLSRYLPVNGPWIVDQMSTRAYVSQFSDDGSLLIAAFQGSQIRIYDVEREWKVRKNILARSLRWTITDTSLSPDQRCLVYASMSPVIQIVDAGSSTSESLANITVDFCGDMLLAVASVSCRKSTTVWISLLRMMGDTLSESFLCNSLLLAKKLWLEAAMGIYTFVTSTRKKLTYYLSSFSYYLLMLMLMSCLQSDVNSVCFVDESGNLICSGSDDSFCKVWDRRCFAGSGKPAGVLMGHLEGITFTDSRRDGRYLITNSKDQSIKLWDLRKMSPNSVCYRGYRNYEWDYRWMNYPQRAKDFKHPHDQSVATYKGHSVLRTLIRCYFSPQYSTGQKYIYTGSHDSCIYIYDLVSGAQVAKLQHHGSTVRDCSWHPTYPVLVSSAWDGEVVKWEFPGNGESTISNTK